MRARLKPTIAPSEAEVAESARKRAMAEQAMGETGVEARDKDMVRGALIAGSPWNSLIKKYKDATEARFNELMAPPAPKEEIVPTSSPTTPTVPEATTGKEVTGGPVSTPTPTVPEPTVAKEVPVDKATTAITSEPLVAPEETATTEQEDADESGAAEVEAEDEDEVEAQPVAVTATQSKSAKKRAKKKQRQKARATAKKGVKG